MTTNVVLWIDHRKAVLNFLTYFGEELKGIESNVKRRVPTEGGSRSTSREGPHDVAPDNMLVRKYSQHLNVFN